MTTITHQSPEARARQLRAPYVIDKPQKTSNLPNCIAEAVQETADVRRWEDADGFQNAFAHMQEGLVVMITMGPGEATPAEIAPQTVIVTVPSQWLNGPDRKVEIDAVAGLLLKVEQFPGRRVATYSVERF